MPDWFNRDKIKSLEGQIRELRDRIDRLERSGNADEAQERGGCHIRIDTMNVDRPVLESLLFRLDRLDIEELSGSLNLGNNFDASRSDKALASGGVRMERPGSRPSREKESGGESPFQSTAKGFSVKI